MLWRCNETDLASQASCQLRFDTNWQRRDVIGMAAKSDATSLAYRAITRDARNWHPCEVTLRFDPLYRAPGSSLRGFR